MAPILQYTAPTMIVLWFAWRRHQLPEGREVLGVILTLVGVFLVSTTASWTSWWLVRWLCFGDCFPAWSGHLYGGAGTHLKKFSPRKSWAGARFCPASSWLVSLTRSTAAVWDASSIAAMMYIVIGGTVIPFSMFLIAVTVVGPTKASLISCVEPLEQYPAGSFGFGNAADRAGYCGDELHHCHGFVIINTEEVAAVLGAAGCQQGWMVISALRATGCCFMGQLQLLRRLFPVCDRAFLLATLRRPS